MEFEELESEWFQMYPLDTIQVHSKHGNCRKKEMIILSLNVSFNTILSTDIYVPLEQELCLLSRSEYTQIYSEDIYISD